MSYKNLIIKENRPNHIAIIMDGNGRWAKKIGNIRLVGHKKGANSVNEVIEACVELEIKYLTLYAFSTENWNRPKTEIEGLMSLLLSTLEKELEKLKKHGVRLKTIGDISKLPQSVELKLKKAIEETATNTGLTLTLALSYSSRWEITEMVKSIVEKYKNTEITENEITSNLIESHLSTKDIPDPELLIRTSGEYRLSNFLLWQIAYTELYFTDTLWPDFKKEDLYKAIADYQKRERRFGKTGEQISNEA
ncbi:MAG: isoprenyl transferase [Bacteroidales bacterium]|nr:isoprenyl transferase [Bacteroidales bacterium]